MEKEGKISYEVEISIYPAHLSVLKRPGEALARNLVQVPLLVAC